MIIRDAKYLISNSDASQCPSDERPEYAFIGRSNVGKSSLINMLTQRKGLALTSSKPGKTRLVNHFTINDQWYLVDLPGYGYAKISKSSRTKFGKLIHDYIEHREALTCLFVLIDSRLEPQQIDIDFIRTIGTYGVPFAMVFTKTDKVKGAKRHANIKKFKNKLLEEWEELPLSFETSSAKKVGREEILNYIDTINQSLTN